RGRSAAGFADLPRGQPFEYAPTYTAEVILNAGLLGEVVSERLPLHLSGTIFADVPKAVEIAEDVDLANQRVCIKPAIFHFATVQKANVTLTFRKLESMLPDGSPVLGSEIRLLDRAPLDAGPHDLPIRSEDLPAGDYVFQLSG